MKKIIISFLFTLFVLFLAGCGGTREVIDIRPKVIHPPIIQDSLDANWADSLFIGVKVKGNDTTQTVKFIPDSSFKNVIVSEFKKSKIRPKSFGQFQIKIKPDSIIIQDTVQITKPEIIETPFIAKIGIAAIGFIIGVIIVIGISWKIK